MHRTPTPTARITQQDATVYRKALLERLGVLVRAWEAGAMDTLLYVMSPDAPVTSSAHGAGLGQAGLAELLKDSQGQSLSLEMFNEYASTNATRGVGAAYLSGVVSRAGTNVVQFGASLTVDAELQEKGWKFTSLRLQLHWVQGDLVLVSHWRLPTNEVWGPGDPAPAIVSEIDAPWRRAPHALLPFDVNDQLAEAFYRYAWAMDHADFDLMRTCLTDDIAGDFTPLGRLNGIHQVLGALKAFRQRWPWMQHLGRVIHADGSSNGYEARLIVGRVVPGHARYSQGHEVFGAHYELSLMKLDEQWLIHRFEYRPGTVTANRWGQSKGNAPRLEHV